MKEHMLRMFFHGSKVISIVVSSRYIVFFWLVRQYRRGTKVQNGQNIFPGIFLLFKQYKQRGERKDRQMGHLI